MAASRQPPAGPPLGFPRCPECSYLRNGPPHTCLNCAAASFEGIAVTSCPICSQILEGSKCPNWLCSDPARRISKVHAIAYSSGTLRDTILKYKYDGRKGWSLIFGRLLVAWLDQYAQKKSIDLIVANPTYVREGGASFEHTERVVEAASTEDFLEKWPFDIGNPRAILKVIATTKSAGQSALEKRMAAAELRGALRIPDIDRVRGKRILIYDDICTTGSQLDAVAGFLMNEGEAVEVEGIVLARAPWRTGS